MPSGRPKNFLGSNKIKRAFDLLCEGKITKEEFASIQGVSSRTARLWFANSRQPNAEQRARLASFFAIPYDQLFTE